jgi:hypothetical protein
MWQQFTKVNPITLKLSSFECNLSYNAKNKNTKALQTNKKTLTKSYDSTQA